MPKHPFTPFPEVVVRAPANLAFVKYWGKRDAAINLPFGDSVSVCLDAVHTHVSVRPSRPGAPDHVRWNGEPLGAPLLGRFLRVLTAVRERSRAVFPLTASVETTMPHAAGLATSASAMAAFALAAATLHRLELTQREMSALARLGSGSACRSIPGGFACWQRGEQGDGTDSYAHSIAPPGHWPGLAILLVIVSREPKRVSSTGGMLRTAQTSPHFEAWTQRHHSLAQAAVHAIRRRDFESLASISELSFKGMHAICLTASPPILYMNERTIMVLELAHDLKKDLPLFTTVDAGPNPFFVTLAEHVGAVRSAVEKAFPAFELHECRPGPGATVISPPEPSRGEP